MTRRARRGAGPIAGVAVLAAALLGGVPGLSVLPSASAAPTQPLAATPDTPSVTATRIRNAEVRVDWDAGSANGTNRTGFVVTVPGCGACHLPAAGPDVSSLVVEDVPTGDWVFDVQATATDPGTGDEADSPVGTSAALTLHTVRYVSAPHGEDTFGGANTPSDCTVGSDHTLVNSVGESAPCASIGRALTVAGPGDEVAIYTGTYPEGADAGPGGLRVSQHIDLVGDPSSALGSGPVVIDATGHADGVVVALDNASDVVDAGAPVVSISGLTIKNAGAAGLLATSSAGLRFAGNTLTGNGVGALLSGVNNSAVTGNTITANTSGLALDDLTGAAWHDTVSANNISNNLTGDGITVVARSSWFSGQAAGVFANVIRDNTLIGDGSSGAGAGIALDVEAAGGELYENTIKHNTIKHSGRAGISLRSRSALDYMDDNVLDDNTIRATGPDAGAGAHAPVGIALAGIAADPIGGTVLRNNTVSDVHYGVFANESTLRTTGNAFDRVAVEYMRVPASLAVFAFKAGTGELWSTRDGRSIRHLGGSPASAPAVTTVPRWSASHGYRGGLLPVYAARMTDGRLRYRTDGSPWHTLPLPSKVHVRGSPSVLGAIEDAHQGTSELTVAFVDTDGNLWLEDVTLNADFTLGATNLAWTDFGHAAAGLRGSPALEVIDGHGFFEPVTFVAASDGSVYSHDSDPSHGWVRTPFAASSVSGGVTPDWTTAVLVLAQRVKTGLALSTVANVEGTWGSPVRQHVNARGQPAAAVATNAVTVAFAAASGELMTRTGGVTRRLHRSAVGGVGAVALN